MRDDRPFAGDAARAAYFYSPDRGGEHPSKIATMAIRRALDLIGRYCVTHGRLQLNIVVGRRPKSLESITS